MEATGRRQWSESKERHRNEVEGTNERWGGTHWLPHCFAQRRKYGKHVSLTKTRVDFLFSVFWWKWMRVLRNELQWNG